MNSRKTRLLALLLALLLLAAPGAMAAPATYQVTYHCNWESHGFEAQVHLVQEVAAGEAVTPPEEPEGKRWWTPPCYSSLEFDGWYTDPECTRPYDFSQPLEDDLELYADWSVLYALAIRTVTYHYNWEQYGFASEIYLRRQIMGYSETEPEPPVGESWTGGDDGLTVYTLEFTGWYWDPDCTELFDFTSSPEGDFDLYAGWDCVTERLLPEPGESEPDLAVTYYYNLRGGLAGEVDGEVYTVQAVEYGQPVSPPAPPETVTSGDKLESAEFLGWYLDPDCTEPYDFSAPVITNTLDLYADWVYSEIIVCYGEPHYAYLTGYPDGTIGPEENISRDQAASIFLRIMGQSDREAFWTKDNHYSDVAPGDWFNNAVSTTTEMGLFTGYDDGTFRPGADITRAELTVTLLRLLGEDELDTGGDGYTDTAGHWAADAINRAGELGWVQGYPDGTFRPDQTISRAEAAAIINRATGRQADGENLPEGMLTWPDNMDETKWYYLDIQAATNSVSAENGSELVESPDWTVLQTPDATPDLLEL